MILAIADAWLTCGLPIGILFVLGLISNWMKAKPRVCRLCQSAIKRKYYHADIDGQHVVLCPQCFGNIKQRASRMAVAAAMGEPVKNRILTLPAVDSGQARAEPRGCWGSLGRLVTIVLVALGLFFLFMIGSMLYMQLTEKPYPAVHSPPPAQSSEPERARGVEDPPMPMPPAIPVK